MYILHVRDRIILKRDQDLYLNSSQLFEFLPACETFKSGVEMVVIGCDAIRI